MDHVTAELLEEACSTAFHLLLEKYIEECIAFLVDMINFHQQIITEWIGLEGTTVGDLIQPPCPHRFIHRFKILILVCEPLGRDLVIWAHEQ